jgi:hypothetical protein
MGELVDGQAAGGLCARADEQRRRQARSFTSDSAIGLRFELADRTSRRLRVAVSMSMTIAWSYPVHWRGGGVPFGMAQPTQDARSARRVTPGAAYQSECRPGGPYGALKPMAQRKGGRLAALSRSG